MRRFLPWLVALLLAGALAWTVFGQGTDEELEEARDRARAAEVTRDSLRELVRADSAEDASADSAAQVTLDSLEIAAARANEAAEISERALRSASSAFRVRLSAELQLAFDSIAAQTDTVIASLRDQITSQRATIAVLRGKVERKDGRIARLSATVTAGDGALEEKNELIEKLERRLRVDPLKRAIEFLGRGALCGAVTKYASAEAGAGCGLDLLADAVFKLD